MKHPPVKLNEISWEDVAGADSPYRVPGPVLQVAHYPPYVIWKIAHPRTSPTYTIAHRGCIDAYCYGVGPLEAQCMLYHLLSYSEGNDDDAR